MFGNRTTGFFSAGSGGSGSGTVTSVGLTMPSAFNVSNSPITSSGDIGVTGAGTINQYIRGDGTLANFPNVGGGGGQIYYFNGNTSQGTISGNTYYQLGIVASAGAAANFTRATTGVIARFITDIGVPNQINIPAGNWAINIYLSEAGGGSNNAEIRATLFKYDGATVTDLFTSSIEQITNGSNIDLYSFDISVGSTTILATDRLGIYFTITNTNGKTVTLYTEDGRIGQVATTFSTGITSLNSLTAPTQTFATGTTGTDFNISSATSTHTFNLPTASGTNRGALSTADWTTFNSKVGGSGTTNYIPKFSAASTLADSSIFDNGTSVGIGTATPSATYKLDVAGSTRLGSLTSQTVLMGNGLNFDLSSSRSRAFSNSGIYLQSTLSTGTRLLLGTIGGNSATTGLVESEISIGDVSQTSGTFTNTRISGRNLSSSGTAVYNYLEVRPDLQTTGSYAGTLRGFYYNPVQSLPFGGTQIAFENTVGSVIHGNLSGTGTRMVTADSTGLLGTQDLTPYANNWLLEAYQDLGSAFKSYPLTIPQGITAITTNSGLTDGSARFVIIYVPLGATITGVKWYQTTQGVYTADNYNGVGLYSYSSGSLTLVASSTDDGDIWKAASNTWATKAFSSTYVATAGIFVIGALYNSSAQTTAPAIGAAAAASNNAVMTNDFTNSAKISSSLGAQTTLPASTAMSSLTVNNTNIAFWLY